MQITLTIKLYGSGSKVYEPTAQSEVSLYLCSTSPVSWHKSVTYKWQNHLIFKVQLVI
ncbi:hypothetical protein [Anaerobutyricum soehngenii]|uniref:hypothetical protein n=1 Tax=Anaerobutyricum soehngenii TaxID=105843 RepID=UPI001ADDDAD4|nr:hypothetical protein [Anaerobutyricum soehngenii]